MAKAVIYARVSSKEQEQSGFSIPAQIRFLSDYATKQGLEIVKIFSESMSAKDEGRIEFDAMFSFLKKHKDITNIIVEKNDRLLRNDFDSAKIVKMATTSDLNFHVVKDNMILSKKSTPHEVFIFTMFYAMSALYPRNLSNEVKKGMAEKAELGFYPARAPIGYKNIRESKKHSYIVVDNDTSPFVKKVFKLYASGNYSLRGLAKKMTTDGFYPYKAPCSKIMIEKILKNPFYMGEFDHGGRRYTKAQHEPLISKELFYTAKEQREGTGCPRSKTSDFLYRGMIRCSHCGGVLSPELKHGASNSGDYIYYRCTRKTEKGCKTKTLKQKFIDEFILDIFKKIQINEQDKKSIIEIVKQKYIANIQFEEKSREQIELQIKVFETRLNKLYLDKLDGVIDDDFYFDKKESWQIKLDKLEMQRNNILQEKGSFIQRADNILELCKNAHRWYLKQNYENKRNMLKLFFSNFFYDGSNLNIELKSTFELMLKSAVLVNGGGKETTLELIASHLYDEINNSDNIILFEQIRIFLAA